MGTVHSGLPPTCSSTREDPVALPVMPRSTETPLNQRQRNASGNAESRFQTQQPKTSHLYIVRNLKVLFVQANCCFGNNPPPGLLFFFLFFFAPLFSSGEFLVSHPGTPLGPLPADSADMRRRGQGDAPPNSYLSQTTKRPFNCANLLPNAERDLFQKTFLTRGGCRATAVLASHRTCLFR